MTSGKQATKQQKQYIYGLCGFNKEVKATAVLSISNGRTESTNDLDFNEADALIKRLKGTKHSTQTPRHLQFDLSNSKHKYILSLCIQLGWTKPHPKFGTVANMETLNNWLMSPKSPVKQCLMDVPYIHLSKIIHALEQIQIK